MKKINLTNYSYNNGKYTVHLGHDAIKTFTSERDCKKYLADVSAFLTQIAYSLQNIHKEVFCHYVNNWAYFDNDKKTGKVTLFNNDRTAQARLNDVQKHFNLLVDRCQYSSGNVFSFRHLNIICDCLTDVMQILTWLQDQRASRRELYTYNEIITRIQLIKYSINNYSNPNNVLLKIAA